jgi:hypothetical protein
LKGLVDGNYPVEIYIHLLDVTRNSCENGNFRPLAGLQESNHFKETPKEILKQNQGNLDGALWKHCM